MDSEGHDFSEKKEFGVLIRIFIGRWLNSFWNSVLTSDDATISSFLQKKINNLDNGLKIEILNAGINSAYSYTSKYHNRKYFTKIST